MGAAKRRGTKAERQVLAIKKEEEIRTQKYLEWKKIEDSKTPEQKSLEKKNKLKRDQLMTQLLGFGLGFGGVSLLDRNLRK